MPRTRNKKTEPAAEGEFNPAEVAGTTETEGGFFDSQNRNENPDDEGDLPPDHDDGSGTAADDPSATTPLGNTVAGMTEGAQAAAAELKEYIRRMENLLEEAQTIKDDMKELRQEIKGKGYDMKAFALVLKLAGLDEGDKKARREQNSVNATYAHAVGIDEDLL